MFFSRVWKIRHLFCLENPFMSRLVLSATVIVFHLWLAHDLFHLYHSVTPYVEYVDSLYRRLIGGLL